MPLTATERRRLGVVRPELYEKLLKLIDAGEAMGFTLALPEYGGTRSSEVQAQLRADSVAQGVGGDTAYAVAKPGTSRHEYGAAFDLHIIAGGDDPDGRGSIDDYRRLAEASESLGLEAGYYFAWRYAGSKQDEFHHQLSEPRDVSIARWQSMQIAGTAPTREVLLSGSPSSSSPAPASPGSSPLGSNHAKPDSRD